MMSHLAYLIIKPLLMLPSGFSSVDNTALGIKWSLFYITHKAFILKMEMWDLKCEIGAMISVEKYFLI